MDRDMTLDQDCSQTHQLEKLHSLPLVVSRLLQGSKTQSGHSGDLTIVLAFKPAVRPGPAKMANSVSQAETLT